MSSAGALDKTALFKYIKRVHVAFNPFQAQATATRMWLPALHSDRILKVNEQFRLETDVGTHVTEPAIAVDYKDGKSTRMSTRAMSFADIDRALFAHAKVLENKEQGI